MPLIVPLLRSNFVMGAAAAAHLLAPCRRLCCHRLLSTNLRMTPSRTVLFALKPSRFRPPRQLSVPTREVHHAPLDAEMDIDKRFNLLVEKMEELGFQRGDCIPGHHKRICPKCKGGESKEKSLYLKIREDGRSAMWTCYRAKCNWSSFIKDGKMLNVGLGHPLKDKNYRVPTEEELELEPLCEEILAYLNERMISAETLRRNAVMQRRYRNQTVIAFTYRRNGNLVSCKYRGIDKMFWQEENTEKIFYGLDDIRNASDVIIVEGEMDKLAMEEAGFRNCVSVPNGAPGKVKKDLPPDEDKDTNFQYLWNCKEYLNQASRIFLATDADAPGQALAEELARRLGKERCWRVNWPIKCGTEVFKDANEVLMYKGPHALREVIDGAELYPIRGLFNFSSFFVEIDDYYYCRNGYECGVSTGWRALHDLYNASILKLNLFTAWASMLMYHIYW